MEPGSRGRGRHVDVAESGKKTERAEQQRRNTSVVLQLQNGTRRTRNKKKEESKGVEGMTER
jgi:hypothetical protein